MWQDLSLGFTCNIIMYDFSFIVKRDDYAFFHVNP